MTVNVNDWVPICKHLFQGFGIISTLRYELPTVQALQVPDLQ